MNGPAALLLRYDPVPASLDAIPSLAEAVIAAHPSLFEQVDANRALDGSHLYMYFWTRRPDALTAGVRETVRAAALRLLPPQTGSAELLQLEPALDVAGASAQQRAGYHYVVETDVLPAIADDLIAWYVDEHLPGLASVPGNARARRLDVVTDGMPRSHACYDLLDPSVTRTEPWLAVRATPWAERVREHFRNTRRVMCERIYLRETNTAQS